jgi:hypothetical protein
MSKWSEYKEKNGVTPLDILNPQTKPATLELFNQRFEICKGCEFLTHHTSRCQKCGCFMKVKTRLEAAKCPLGKW